MTYALRFQSGFTVDIPAKLLAGPSRDLKVFLRVIPEGRPPVYLAMTGTIQNLDSGRGDIELNGQFAVGEGSYGVEVLVEDEVPRACYSKWQIQARRTSAEGDLKLSIPPGAVVEAAASNLVPLLQTGPQIDRLTILVHATSAKPLAATMEDETITDLADAVQTLLTQLPARSVRLAVFNLDRQLVLLQKDAFQPSNLPELIQVFEQLELAVVDAKTAANRDHIDVLSDLLAKEGSNSQPSSAVILIGPRTFETTNPAKVKELHRGSTPWFYLQYLQTSPSEQPIAGRGGPLPAAPIPANRLFDGIEWLVHEVDGVTLAMWSAHDFTAALHRMDAEIPRVNVSGGAPSAEPATQPAFDADRTELTDLTGDEDPAAVLAAMRDRVLTHAARIPNHTCVEKVQRDRYALQTGPRTQSCEYALAARRMRNHRVARASTDWLRLDVGMALDREMFSLPGAPAFEKEDIEKLVPDGAFGTGAFATMLLSVLQNRNPHFILDGETKLDGRRVWQYSFRVPQEESHYRVKAPGDWVITGFTGALLVDPKTSDLVRFRLRTDELPAATHNCEIDTTLDYSMVELGKFEYLLPASTRQRFLGVDGSEVENKVTFGSCREFRGESTLSFGETADAAAKVPTQREIKLPAGAQLIVEVTTPFTLGQAAAGDRIDGRLVEPLRDSAGAIVVPSGAKLAGRLTRVELRYAREAQYAVALRWESLEIDGASTPLTLKPKEQIASMEADGRRALPKRGAPIELPHPMGPQEVTYLFPAIPGPVRGGLRTVWFTVSVN